MVDEESVEDAHDNPLQDWQESTQTPEKKKDVAACTEQEEVLPTNTSISIKPASMPPCLYEETALSIWYSFVLR